MELTLFTFPETGQLMLPTFPGDPCVEGLEGYLYIVEFDAGGIKVGYTTNPKSRISQYRTSARVFGRKAVRGVLTPPHVEAKPNESTLINWCRSTSGLPDTYRGEYFPMSLDYAAKFLGTLPQTRGDKAAHEVKSRNTLELLKNLTGLGANRHQPVFQWATYLDPGDRAVFFNELRDAMEEPDGLAALDRVYAKWRAEVSLQQEYDAPEENPGVQA
jgi:hypothetical protein